MTAMTTATFPLDTLIDCGNCGDAMDLVQEPKPRYTCPNDCGAPALDAAEFNMAVIAQVLGSLINEDTFSTFREMMNQHIDEETQRNPGVNLEALRNDDELHRLITEPKAIITESMRPYTENILCNVIKHIEATAGTATVHYVMPLPGQNRQTINLPELLTK